MCIKLPFPKQVLKDVMLFYKPSLERVSGRPIGLILLRCGKFPGEDQSRSCKWMRWCGDVRANGCSDDREMYGLSMDVSEEGELHLVMDANVSKPIQYPFFTFLSYFFFFQENSWGTLPWHDDQW
jgi:hypothetical protein